MAANTDPVFGLTPNVGVGRITTGITTRDTSVSTPTTIFTAGTNGSRLDAVRIKAETDLADSVVIVWLKIGGTWYLFDEFDVGDPAAGSTTAAAYGPETKFYRDLNLQSGVLVGATITVTPTTGGVNVFGIGVDF